MSVIQKLRNRFRPRLRTVMLITNLAILILPLISLFFFRIYENQLIQQTEGALISQAAFLGAAYESEIDAQLALASDNTPYGVQLTYVKNLRKKQKTQALNTQQINRFPYYLAPQLDLAKDDTLPPRPDPQISAKPMDTLAAKIAPKIAAIVKKGQQTTLSGIRVLDFNGVVIAGGDDIGKSFAQVSEVKSALWGRYTPVIRKRISDEPPPPLASISRGTGIRLFVAYPIRRDQQVWGVVYLSRTPKNALQHLYLERKKLIWAALSILLLTALFTLFTSLTISQPIQRLIEKTRLIAKGDKAGLTPLRSPKSREMENLSASFSAMAKQLFDRSDYIKKFATHVSHEFKTPLTSIKGATEILQDHASSLSKEEAQKFLSNIDKDTDRLNLLVSRLLDLARADTIVPSEETLDLQAYFSGITTKHDTGLALDIVHQNTKGVAAPISADNFDMVIKNLLENAHGNGATNMHIETRLDKHWLVISFHDNGSGISPANRDKIFTPFFTTRRGNGGTGLGLDIVRSIIEAHKGTIALVPTDKGAKFAVRLPNTS